MCIIILNLNKHHPKLVPHPPLNNAVPVGFHRFLTRLDFSNTIIVTKNIQNLKSSNCLYVIGQKKTTQINIFKT